MVKLGTKLKGPPQKEKKRRKGKGTVKLDQLGWQQIKSMDDQSITAEFIFFSGATSEASKVWHLIN